MGIFRTSSPSFFILVGALFTITTLHFLGLLNTAPHEASLRPSELLADFQQQPRNVYFDIGANNGDSILEFLAARSALTWDVVLVEATPRFTAQLRELCARVTQRGAARSCLPLVETALTTYDGFVNIFVEEQRKEKDASTIMASANVLQGAGAFFNATALDVLTLFRKVFPVRGTDNVVVKVDIEGAEFPVFKRAIFHGLLPLWDEVFTEWHDNNVFIFGGKEQAKHAALRQCLTLVMEAEGQKVGAWT